MPGIFLVADAHETSFEQPDYEGDDLAQGYSASREVLLDLIADQRQRLAKFYQPVEFGLFSDLSEPRMVAILLPAFGVDTGGLQMALWIFTDPNVSVRRRYSQLANAIKRSFISERLPVRFAIGKSLSRASPRDARERAVYIVEARFLGRTNNRLVGGHGFLEESFQVRFIETDPQSG
jgi:hypothetical protein